MSDLGAAPVAIVWYRRDLRLHDHPALWAAANDAPSLVPLYVLHPALIGGRFASPNRTWFLLGSLAALRDGLRAAGSDLVVRVGDPRTVIPHLARRVGAGAVHVSRDHAPYGRARDAAVAQALADVGVRWVGHRGNLVHEPEDVRTGDGGPYTVYSPFRRAWAARTRRAVRPAPERLPPLPDLPAAGASAALEPGDIPTLADLGLGDGPTADPRHLPEPGEPAARRRLARWIETGLDDYAQRRDRMDIGDGTSRLSADLHLGLLSPLEVAERAAGAGEGRRIYGNELIWREFYAHVLFHHPRVRRTAFRAGLDAIEWSTDTAGFEAWAAGRTGYPVVDAAMRQLLAMGWMHNRARMIAASFLTKHLLIHWRTGEAHFMRHLVDGDVASNNGGWQWSASTGTDPQPYFRIFNPILQGRRFDPDGDYVRRWVPELARVSATRIHAPWELTAQEQHEAGCRIGIDYPAPIVDHAYARARALATYGASRQPS